MRYDIFNSIHKTLRRITYDSAIAIQQTDFSDSAETGQLAENIGQTLSLLEMHIQHETTFIHPMIEKFDIDIDRHFREKHIHSRFLAKQVERTLKDAKMASDQNDRIKLGKFLLEQFETLLCYNLALFVKEEQVLNHILWNNYNDGQIRQTEREIIAAVPEDVLAFETLMLIRSLNNSELRAWLSGIQEYAAFSDFDSALALAEQQLPSERFEKLTSQITTGKPSNLAS